jgi:hypothetical protein
MTPTCRPWLITLCYAIRYEIRHALLAFCPTGNRQRDFALGRARRRIITRRMHVHLFIDRHLSRAAAFVERTLAYMRARAASFALTLP